jgi:hypothetical protein
MEECNLSPLPQGAKEEMTKLNWRDELSEDPLVRYEQLRENPWLFLKYCVLTHDEVDQENPIKPYPSHLLYLKFLTMMWVKRKRLAIPKSRRLTVSWTFIALALWDCLFHKGRSWAFVSKKEEDSKELVQRANFIYEQIPEEILARDLLPKRRRDEMQSSPPVLDFETIRSKIQGFPSGGNQLRQRGFSGILEDECAFWEDAEAAYASAEPTIKGGGRMVMVSTRFPGFFKKIVYDKLDSKDLNFSELPPVETKHPMEGIEVWTNPRNGFTVIDLSHRANPAKRSPEFEEGLKRTLPIHLYRMEYGKSWDTFEGKAVYEDFNELIHCTKVKPKLHVGLPVLLGWDSSGLTPACVIAQLQGEQLFVFREIVASGMGARRFIPHVIAELALHFPQITDLEKQTISFFDPAGFKKNEITEETYLHELISKGFKQIRPGPQRWKKRVEGVTNYLIGLSGGKAKLQIWEADCPILVAGFKGGFRYPDKTIQAEPDDIKPIKDIHSHPHDAFQYLCGGLQAYKNTNYNIEIPAPSYGFQKTLDIMPKTRKHHE